MRILVNKSRSPVIPLSRYPVIPFLCSCVLVLSGCASITELGRGISGTSTKILEEKRVDALKLELGCDYNACYQKVKSTLEKAGCYIYRENPAQGLIAFYVSETDTTPVGIFLRDIDSGGTLIEVSSPSTFAKEYIAQKLSSDLRDLLKKEEKEAVPPEGKADEKK